MSNHWGPYRKMEEYIMKMKSIEVTKSEKFSEESKCMPVKNNCYVQYVVRPVRVVNGCVTTLRE